jgi:membrane-associated phospholipid phosphatase
MSSVITYALVSLLIIVILTVHQKSYWKDNLAITLDIKREIAICLVCLGLSFTSIELQKEKEANFSKFEIGSLDNTVIQQINSIDRSIAGRWDIEAKDQGKMIKNTAIYLIPLSLLFFIGSVKRRLALFFVFSQGYVLTESLTGIAKALVHRYRPFAYRTVDQVEALSLEAKEKFMEDIADYDIMNSFFSGDASIIGFGLIFFSYSFSQFYKGSKYKNAVWVMSIIGIALGCYFRSLSGKHFPTDVLIGGLVGASIAFFIILIHQKKGALNEQ